MGITTLLQLGQFVHRDPQAYFEEVSSRYQHLVSTVTLVFASPSQLEKSPEDLRALCELCKFVASTSTYFPQTICKSFSTMAVDSWLSDPRFPSLPLSFRLALVQAVMSLRAKNQTSTEKVFASFVPLLGSAEKQMRRMIFGYLVKESKRTTQDNVKKSMQSVLFNSLKKCTNASSESAENHSADLIASSIVRIFGILFVSRVWWSDATTAVNVVASEALFNPHEKVVTAALHFFLNLKTFGKSDEIDNDDRMEQIESERLTICDRLKKGPKVKDRTARKMKRRAKLLQQRIKSQQNEDNEHEAVGDMDFDEDASVDGVSSSSRVIDLRGFEHIEWLNNPLTIAERLFASVRQSQFSFDMRIMQLDLVSRIMAIHHLVIPNFGPFMAKFVRPSQAEVTKLLAVAVQSVHKDTPADCVLPLLQSLSDNFVSESNDGPSIAIGLNTIRTLCLRCPSGMRDIGGVLVNDWLSYRKFKTDKSVVMAARGVLEIARTVVPHLLHRRDFGKEVSEKMSQAKRMKMSNSRVGEEQMENDSDDGWRDVEDLSENEDDEENEDEFEIVDEDDPELDDNDNVDVDDDDDDDDDVDDDDDEDSADIDDDAVVDTQQLEANGDDDDLMGIVLDPEALQPVKANSRKRTREERIESVNSGREDREKFGFRKLKGGGTTNQEKQKTKLPQMVQQSRKVREKMGLSLRDKQLRKGTRRSRVKKQPKRFRK
eukprot:ANDGO_00187.mRNA.1 Protein SDA1 homolog